MALCEKRSARRTCPTSSFSSASRPSRAGPYLPPFRPAFLDGYGCRAVVLRPESRGSLTLASADPRASCCIRAEFLLATTKDLQDHSRWHAHDARDLGASAVAALRHGEIACRRKETSDAELNAYIRKTATTVYHPLGTCKMGGDARRDRGSRSGIEACKGIEAYASSMPR